MIPNYLIVISWWLDVILFVFAIWVHRVLRQMRRERDRQSDLFQNSNAASQNKIRSLMAANDKLHTQLEVAETKWGIADSAATYERKKTDALAKELLQVREEKNHLQEQYDLQCGAVKQLEVQLETARGHLQIGGERILELENENLILKNQKEINGFPM